MTQNKHNILTKKLKKRALSAFESKRYWLDCGIHSYSYGHYRIKESAGHCSTCNISIEN